MAMNASLQLSDKVVAITGGSRGVGAGISRRFLAAGAKVCICARHLPDQPTSAPEEQPTLFSQVDVRDPDSIDRWMEEIIRRFGQLDVLINNAGGTPAVAAAASSPRLCEAVLRLNLLAPLFVAQRANRHMQDQENGGCIINIASVSAIRPSPGTAIYGAAKAGLVNLGASLAAEWAPKVRVNTVIAGLVKTEQIAEHYGDAATQQAVAATIPLARMALPGDIGNACLFLASPLASYISGAALTVHGGGERSAYLQSLTPPAKQQPS